MKRSRSRFWWLLPICLVIPVAAGMLWAWGHYGQQLQILLTAGIKVVIRP